MEEINTCIVCNDIITENKESCDFTHEACVIQIHTDCLSYGDYIHCPHCGKTVYAGITLFDDCIQQSNEELITTANHFPPLKEPLNMENICNICGLDEIIDDNIIIKTSCDHLYHYDCLAKWFVESAASRRECPYCSRGYDKIAQIAGREYIKNFNKVIDLYDFKIGICDGEDDGCNKCSWYNQYKYSADAVKEFIAINPELESVEDYYKIIDLTEQPIGILDINNVSNNINKCSKYATIPILNMCLEHFEKNIKLDYHENLIKYKLNKYFAAIDTYSFCSHMANDPTNKCNKKTIIIVNGIPYCKKHSKEALLVAAANSNSDMSSSDSSEEEKQEKNIITRHMQCSYMTSRNMRCRRANSLISGELCLCTRHYLKSIEEESQAAFVQLANKYYELAYVYREYLRSRICKGYFEGREKCTAILGELGGDYCGYCKYYPRSLIKKYARKKCKWRHPITRAPCAQLSFDMNSRCVFHTEVFYLV
jgi:hypothetical protein